MNHYTVCPDCHGEGKVMTPSMRGYAYTQEEVEEEGCDGMTFGEEMAMGMYDISCPTCNGKRVVTEEELEAHQSRKAHENSWEYRFEQGCCGGY